MDKTFKNDLQTHIQNLGVKDKKFQLKETQHPLDKWLHECFVADNLYRIGGQRRDIARGIIKTELATSIEPVVKSALDLHLTQNEQLLNTGNYLLDLQVKKPSLRLDVVRLKTELFKAGVSQAIIDAVWDKCLDEQRPVEVYTVNTARNGD